VFDRDNRVVRADGGCDDVVVEACTDDGPARATFAAVQQSAPVDLLREGEKLRDAADPAGRELGTEYGWRAGDELPLYRERGLVHRRSGRRSPTRSSTFDVARGSWIPRSDTATDLVSRRGSPTAADRRTTLAWTSAVVPAFRHAVVAG